MNHVEEPAGGAPPEPAAKKRKTMNHIGPKKAKKAIPAKKKPAPKKAAKKAAPKKKAR